jgi:outer membrane protein OmpA-like peptidoglycan-associated protein
MLKKCFTKFVLILCTCIVARAQTELNFYDAFDNNSHGWWVGSSDSYNVRIEDGKMFIDNLKGGNREYHFPIDIEDKKDFFLEVNLRQYKGIDNQGYGVYWGSSDVSNAYYFVISSTGYFRIFKIENNSYVYTTEWKKTPLLNPLGSFNKIKVERKGQAVAFYINNEKVHEIDRFPKFYGIDAGFVVNSSEIDIEIDEMTIRKQVDKINLLTDKLTGYKKENLGKGVNSIYDDVLPVISPDGKTLYIDRFYPKKDNKDETQTDIWYAEKNGDTWGAAKDIGFPLNNPGNNAVYSVTPDNNTLFLGNTYNADGSIRADGFSMSHRTKTGWSIPKDVIIKDYYNDSKHKEVYLCNDGKTLLFAIERKDGYGNKDIHVSFLQSDGEWSAPMNLGAVVNSSENETSPFLAADNKTLYYASAGKPGYGSSDIFVTRRLDDTWKKWSEPKNLGPEINSMNWDGYYTIPASGDYAYLVSTENSIGRGDIFRIKLQEEAKPEPVVLIHGKVLNSKTKQPIGADISYELLPSAKELGIATSNPVTGEYKIIIPYGEHYGYHAKAQGYISINENFDIVEKKEYIEISQDLYLTPIEVGQAISLNNVFFVQSKAQMLPASFAELDRLVKILQENPGIEIELRGHTDSYGDAKLNLELSENRVKAVKDYLVSKGVSSKRIVGKGFGGTQPIASNATEATRKLNRRVEFVIVKQ